jgi:hypothetical protein
MKRRENGKGYVGASWAEAPKTAKGTAVIHLGTTNWYGVAVAAVFFLEIAIYMFVNGGATVDARLT